MGVNMAGNCITSDEICKDASNQEIIRRYYDTLYHVISGTSEQDELVKIEYLMKKANISLENRKVVKACLEKENDTKGPSAAIELEDGTVVIPRKKNFLAEFFCNVRRSAFHQLTETDGSCMTDCIR